MKRVVILVLPEKLELGERVRGPEEMNLDKTAIPDSVPSTKST